MHNHRSDDVDVTQITLSSQAGLVRYPTADDETGEASFPASDPPATWTWDVAGRPPGSPHGEARSVPAAPPSPHDIESD
jgi:hypothetical protein